MKRIPLPLLGVAMSAALLVACGSSGSGTPAAPADAGLVVQAVTGNRFDKAEYTAKAGSVKVAYLGEPSTNHTLLITTPDNTTIGPKLKAQAGGQDEGTFDLAAGTYNMLCDVPGHDQMKATLVVS